MTWIKQPQQISHSAVKDGKQPPVRSEREKEIHNILKNELMIPQLIYISSDYLHTYVYTIKSSEE